ncbi:MAG: hypothetical protein JXX28_18125 [Deltaproteobacteria bacterium]|nr:hypothetical protein [Deltaproteobacteria bacterium]
MRLWSRSLFLALSLSLTAPLWPVHQAAQAAEVEPVVAEVLGVLADVQGRYDAMQAGDVRTGNDLLRILKPLSIKLSHAQNKHDPAWGAAVAQYNALNAAIVAKANGAPPPELPQAPAADAAERAPAPATQQARAPAADAGPLPSSEEAKWRRLDQQARSILVSLQGLDPAVLQVPETRAFWEGKIATLKQNMGTFQHPNHPKVVALAQTVSDSEALLKTHQGASDEGAAELGDVRGHFDEIDQWMQANPAPAAPQPPFDPSSVRGFTERAPEVRRRATEDLAWLSSLEGNSYVIPPQEIDRLQSAITFTRMKRLDEAIAQTTENLDRWVERYTGDVERLEALDPTDADQRWGLLQRGALDAHLASVEEGLEAVEVVAAYDAALGREGAPDRAATAARMKAAVPMLKQKYQQGLSLQTLSPALSAPEQLAAAKALMARDWDTKQVERVVVVTQKAHHHEVKLELNSYNEPVTNTYDWDTFVFQTAEKTGEGEYYIFQNVAGFHTADPVLRLNTWVMDERAEGARILPENIAR